MCVQIYLSSGKEVGTKSQKVGMSHMDWQHMYDSCPSRQQKNHIHSEHRPGIPTSCMPAPGMDIEKRKKEIATKQDITEQKRQTNQPRDSRKLKRPTERDWSFPTCLLYVWVLAKYRAIFYLLFSLSYPFKVQLGAEWKYHFLNQDKETTKCSTFSCKVMII